MEMDAFKIDAQVSNLLHSFVYLFLSIDVVSKLAWEGRGKFVWGFLLDGYAPKDAHIWC